MLLPKNYHRMVFNNTRFSILTDDGYKDFSGVARMEVTEPLIKILFEDGEYIVCTHDHKLYTNKTTYEYARSLNVNDTLYSPTKNVRIVSIEEVNERYVYDIIDVDDTRSFLVGKNYIKSSNCVYLDELAFVENDVEFYTSTYPVISSGKKTKIIITSTPNGMNLFYKLWTEAAEKRNEFKNYKVHWSEHPARDDKWAESQIANTSPEQFEVEYNSLSYQVLTSILYSDGTRKEIEIGKLYDEM